MIPVFWHLWKGNWDCSLLREVIEKGDYIEYEGTLAEHKERGKEGGVVIFGYQEDATELIDFLNSLKWFVFIYVSDECNRLDFSQLPKHGIIWNQCWTTAKQPTDRHLLLGHRYDTKEIIKGLNQEKKYPWSFVGQAQESRKKTFQIFERFNNGKLIKTTGFGGANDGLEYKDYLQIYCNSKIVLCPMGNNCPDTFRLYEAIEAGALPIVEGHDYWKEFDIPFPCVSEWGAAEWIIADYELYPEKLHEDSIKAKIWWDDYKEKVGNDLKTDIKKLS